ncbi:MAG: hypothetical protein VKI83_08795 [Synechococcaceae cyanobacterium]|nr:hypothetical protein [Synechococcaceae cyanobacterium]
MTSRDPLALEPLEAFPMPEGAITLPDAELLGTSRAMVLAALQQAMREQLLQLPLGPQSELNNPERCLMLNRIAVQVLPAGMLADAVALDPATWQSGAVPQLLLAALVDEENAVVHFPGVLTAADWAQASSQAERDGDGYLVEVEQFRGGIERLFALVQLLEPAALPHFRVLSGPVVSILDWLSGQVDEALLALGAKPQPIQAAAFRMEDPSDFADDDFDGYEPPGDPLALLTILLGIDSRERLVSGELAEECIEIFQLQLAPFSDQAGSERPNALRLILVATLRDDLLPDGITLRAQQGQHRQEATTKASSRVEFVFQGAEPIEVAIVSSNGSELSLPPLQLHA